MYRILVPLLTVALLTAARMASAEVVIGSPRDGDVVGPSTPIYGRCSERAFIVVITDVLATDGTLVGTVPGIRHWTNDDNSISVRVATPRISFGDKDEPVHYVIHVRAYSSPALANAGQYPDLGSVDIRVRSQ